MAGRIGPLQTALVLLALVACVVVPFFFWQGTWFGRPLQDEELTLFLTDPDKSRRVQHGLSQIAERMERGDPKVAQFEGAQFIPPPTIFTPCRSRTGNGTFLNLRVRR